jgi:hypothetical protein
VDGAEWNPMIVSTRIPANPPLPIGKRTKYGKIAAVGFTGGEREYYMVDKLKTVSRMPAFMVEPSARMHVNLSR